MFKKPSKSGISKQAVTVGSAVVGAAVSDGVVELISDEYKKWGKPAFAIATAIAAAATNNTKTSGKAIQGALLGMSIKQGLDAIRELIATKMTKNEAKTQLADFSNKVLGLASADTRIIVPSIASNIFNRQIAPREEFSPNALAGNAKLSNDILA